MPKKKTTKKRAGQQDKRAFAFLATFLSIIGVVIVLLANKRDPYTMFYTKQGVVLFVFWIIATVLGWVPFFGWLIWVLFVVVWLMAWINALSGEKRDTWLIGDFAKKIKL